MQPDAVDARLSAHAVPIADIALCLLCCTLEVPGIPAQVNGNSVQHKLRTFTPEFPEAERFGAAVENFPSCPQLKLQLIQIRSFGTPQPGVRPRQHKPGFLPLPVVRVLA
ncbi:hypothetical protein D3C87_1620960 [compost metagenome]